MYDAGIRPSSRSASLGRRERGIEVALAAIVEHLIDFFDRYIRGHTEALIYDDGFRRWSYSGDEVRATALMLEGEDYVALARRVQEAVVALRPLPVDRAPRASDAAA
jgi:hypothetical protein